MTYSLQQAKSEPKRIDYISEIKNVNQFKLFPIPVKQLSFYPIKVNYTRKMLFLA